MTDPIGLPVLFVREAHKKWFPAWDYQWVEGPVAALRRRGVDARAVSIQEARQASGSVVITLGSLEVERPKHRDDVDCLLGNFLRFADRNRTILFCCGDWAALSAEECCTFWGAPAARAQDLIRAIAHLYETMAGAAAAVAVGEPGLVEIFAPFNPRVAVVEWAAPDPSQWPPLPPQRRAGPLRIGWAGLDRLDNDFSVVRPALTRLAHERGVEVTFMGVEPSWLKELPGSSFVPRAYVGPREYLATLASLELDLAIAPLAETRVNATRSRSKFTDATSGMGCPLVASDFGPYRRLAAAGAPLVTVPNDPEAWDTALTDLLDDPDRRAALVADARAWVAKYATFDAVCDQWLTALALAVQ